MDDCSKAQAFRQIEERDYCFVDCESGLGMESLKAKLVDFVASSPHTITYDLLESLFFLSFSCVFFFACISISLNSH
jgi:hypothetical protein